MASIEPPSKEERNALVYPMFIVSTYGISHVYGECSHTFTNTTTLVSRLIDNHNKYLQMKRVILLSFSIYTDHKDTKGLLTNSYFDISAQKY